jgi:6-phosphogluconolactonase
MRPVPQKNATSNFQRILQPGHNNNVPPAIWGGGCKIVAACLLLFAFGAERSFAQQKADDSQSDQADRYCLYVSLGGDHKIAMFEMNPQSGALTRRPNIPVEGAPGSLAVDPNHKFLYAAVRSSGTVATFRIDPVTGGLSQLGSVPVVANPVYVVTDTTGRYLFTAYYGAGKVAVYRIGIDGIVQSPATQILEAEKNPHSILKDRSNRIVFVPNTGADSILQYRFDQQTGMLSPNQVPRLTTSAGAGPRHQFFHPTMNLVYFVNEKNSSVTAFQLDPDSGTLAALQTITTLPADFRGKNTCADIEITPDGRFLYASNRGHDSIAGYAIDPLSGRLKSLGQQPTEETPREFNVDPTGNFLFAAGQSSGRLASYRIGPASGRLEPLAIVPVGKSPAWVLVLRLPGK